MYKVKCLYRNSNATLEREANTMESMWAYLHGTEGNKKTGRYRIRITRLSGAELMAMGLAPEGTPSDFFGLQANLDKWHEQYGWIPMLDWVGNPEGDIEDIELELGRQFRSFITGIAIDEDFGLQTAQIKEPKLKPFKRPKKEETKELKNEEAPKETSSLDTTSQDDDDDDDDDDIDWL